MPFLKGQSGNSKGRPPKERALTTLLEKAGSATVDISGERVSGKRLLAMMLWEGVTTGKVTLPDGSALGLDADQWLALTRFIYQHVDGPPKSELGVSHGGAITINVRHERMRPIDDDA